MKDFKYKGKTIKEWEEELKNVEGLDENSNPKWWDVQANLQDATTLYNILKDLNNNKNETN